MSVNLRQQWLHGFLDVCLLCLLAERRDYGLGLTQRLVAAGFDEIPGGTLYPSLLRLEKQGLVETDWMPSATGPRRKYYDLTAAGHDAVADRIGSWRQFRDSVESLTVQAQRAGSERRG
ncbi:PadR family transcriptional regulator [Kribbella sp. NPDC056345]|uniref:PadR family transcriptional regulator n=1 Tax=Kribbella sp. NPDC056345 TaxID=3345789 RepID=UPI0035D94A1A